MSLPRVFLTGGSGFIGRHLLEELLASGIAVTVLDRSGTLTAPTTQGAVRVVRGDLLDPAAYRDALGECDVVVHLAAATGNASRATHHRDTEQATTALCDAARAAGVSRLLLVSSVAVSFPDRSGYPYALAKERAEHLVAESGLRHMIVRPTIVLGPDAPVLRSLTTLATLPVIVVLGSGRARVQPVAVTDLAHEIAAILREDRFANETMTLGGPEVISIEELLRRIRRAHRRRGGAVLHLPLALLAGPLRLLEAVGLGRLLPVTAGQLSSFRFDGTAADTLPRPGFAGVDAMLAIATRRDPDAPATLARECRAFTRHLLGWPADAATLEAYRRAIATVPELAPAGPRDRALLALARKGWMAARIADAWAALFARSSALRKRLVMLLAILESRSPTSTAIDRPLGGSSPLAIAAITGRGLVAIAVLALAIVTVSPVVALARRRGARA